jgi:hypothetical protein
MNDACVCFHVSIVKKLPRYWSSQRENAKPQDDSPFQERNVYQTDFKTVENPEPPVKSRWFSSLFPFPASSFPSFEDVFLVLG